MKRTAVVEGVEAAYRIGSGAGPWLEELVRSVSPELDSGVGVEGLEVCFAPGRRTLGAPVLVGGTSAWQGQWLENWWAPVVEAVEPGALRAMLAFGAISSAQQLWDAAARGIPTLDAHLKVLSERGWAQAFRREGAGGKLFYVDSLNLCALDASGRGVAIVANREEVLRAADLRAARRRFARLAAHITTAVRARASLGDRAPSAEDGEAVLSADGRVLHAQGAATTPAARASLRQAALDMDRARSSRADAAEALALWRCLVEGRWTLLDEFESDGRRYLVALPNAPRERCEASSAQRPASAPSEALSERESEVLAELGRGLSNKEIAYLLGLAPSTVATLVTRVARKLGVENNRVVLVRRARMLGAACEGSGARAVERDATTGELRAAREVGA